jgi:quinol monooxygenase YgiN
MWPEFGSENRTMTEERIQVVAQIFAQAEQEARLKALLLELVEPTRKEAGCLSYQLWQSPVAPTEFVFVEEWVSLEAMEAHLDSPHVQQALLEGAQFFAAPLEIRYYRRLA